MRKDFTKSREYLSLGQVRLDGGTFLRKVNAIMKAFVLSILILSKGACGGEESQFCTQTMYTLSSHARE